MCWADKAGLLWAFVVYAFFFIIAGHRELLFTLGVTRDLAILILPVWIFLRGIDWILGGPARRRGQFKARVIR